MRKLTCLVLAIAFLASGCSQGKQMLIPLTMPDGEEATLVTHQNYVPKWMRVGSALSYIVPGKKGPSNKQLDAVSRVEEACAELTQVTHPHNSVTLLSDAVIFAAAGAFGSYFGSLAFPTAIASQYTQYGAAAGGGFGIPYAAITLSGKDYTFQSCGREIFTRFPTYKVQPIIESTYP